MGGGGEEEKGREGRRRGGEEGSVVVNFGEVTTTATVRSPASTRRSLTSVQHLLPPQGPPLPV